jgi:hypothetical protein
METYRKEGEKFSFYRDGKLIYSVESSSPDIEEFILKLGIKKEEEK